MRLARSRSRSWYLDYMKAVVSKTKTKAKIDWLGLGTRFRSRFLDLGKKNNLSHAPWFYHILFVLNRCVASFYIRKDVCLFFPEKKKKTNKKLRSIRKNLLNWIERPASAARHVGCMATEQAEEGRHVCCGCGCDVIIKLFYFIGQRLGLPIYSDVFISKGTK